MLIGSVASATSLTGCSSTSAAGPSSRLSASPTTSPATRTATTHLVELRSREETVAKFGAMKPTYWGFDAPGVLTRFPTDGAGKDAVALTFDACGGHVLRYNAELIAALRKHEAKATLMIAMKWAQHNPTIFNELLADPLFEIGNHGTRHVPLSVSGRSAYGEPGTRNVGEVWDELAGNFEYQATTWGHRPRFMRSGTAFTDDVASRAADFAGQQLISFGTDGDAGATFPAEIVYQQVKVAPAGSIVIGHMNRPASGTAPGYDRAIPALKARGLTFVQLSEVL